MTQNIASLFYAKKLVQAEELTTLLSKQKKLDESEKEYWLFLIFFTQRKYSGDKYWDEKIEAHLPPIKENEGFNFQILYADWLIFCKKFDEANHVLQTVLAECDDNISEKVLAYAAFSRLYTATNNFKEALRISRDALSLLTKYTVAEAIVAEVYHSLVQAYLKSQEYGNLETYSNTLLELCAVLGDVEKKIVALNNLAIVNSIRNDFKTAMGYFIEALELARSLNYRQSIANSYINIGTIYAHLQNHDEALKRYTNIVESYEDVLEKNTMAIVYNNIGNINARNNDTTEAKKHFEKALALATEIQYQEMIALSLTQLSRVHRSESNTTEALIYAEEARQLIVDLGDINGRQINLINLGQLHYDLGDFDSAIQLTEDGLETSLTAEDDLNTMKAYQLLADIYAHLKDFEKAYLYQFSFTQLHEKVSSEQRNLQAIDIEIRYEIKEKQSQIEQLQKENEYQGQLLEQGKKISKQNTELSQANEELQQFAYVVSHDLKEPLRMIASYIQLIMRRLPKNQSEDIDAYSGFINEGATRMNLLLDGLLQYATIGKENEEEDEMNITEIIEYAMFNLKLLTRETETDITVGEMPILRIIPSRLAQVFQNLLSNGIKFRKSDTQPIINITCERRKNDFLFKVADNGIGISAEHRERIFVIFQRLHTRAQYDGTGIGLSICQKVITRLGGDIWAEGELGVGTTFCFTLPLSLEKKMDLDI
jgi:signal transduction histidine kinase/predicted negative regulator of RcsB-dependent stress response